MGPVLIRNAIRLVIILIAWIIVKRSFTQLGGPARPGGRAELMPWLGLIGGGVMLFMVVRSLVGIRL